MLPLSPKNVDGVRMIKSLILSLVLVTQMASAQGTQKTSKGESNENPLEAVSIYQDPKNPAFSIIAVTACGGKKFGMRGPNQMFEESPDEVIEALEKAITKVCGETL